jgi:hypothetical protein
MMLEITLFVMFLCALVVCIWQARQAHYARKIVARLLIDEILYHKTRGHFLNRRIDSMYSALHLRKLPLLRKRAQEDAWRIASFCHDQRERQAKHAEQKKRETLKQPKRQETQQLAMVSKMKEMQLTAQV